MARLDGPGGAYHLYEVQVLSLGQVGTRQVWAPSWSEARRLVIDFPSCFGLGESVIVLRVTQQELQEQTIDAA